jgi:hypothetical protein
MQIARKFSWLSLRRVKHLHVPSAGGRPLCLRKFGKRNGRDDLSAVPRQLKPVAVATGFSWGACLLGFIWALSKKMWFAAFVMLSVSIILLSMGLWGETADLIGTVLSILFAIGCGIYGNQWHRWTLEKRGYTVL